MRKEELLSIRHNIEKICNKCKEYKNGREFNLKATTKGCYNYKLNSTCRKCDKEIRVINSQKKKIYTKY